MTRTTYCILDAPPDELLDAVDVDRLLEDVCRAMGVDAQAVEAAYAAHPLRIMVRPASELIDLVTRLEGSCGGEARGVCLTATFLMVIRLDWKGLLAHEMTHAIHRLLGQPPSEREARRVADAVTTTNWQALREQTQLDAG